MPTHPLCVVLHYSDYASLKDSAPGVVIRTYTPGQRPREVMEQLLDCALVASTSLHGVIFAEAFGALILALSKTHL